MNWQTLVVPTAAIIFLLFLAWKMRPSLGPPRPGKLRDEIKTAKQRAQQASSPRGRAEALCAVGDLYAADRRRRLFATGQYWRACRADPSWSAPLVQVRTLLWNDRPRTLERFLWRRLASIPWSNDTRPVAIDIARMLASLYREKLGDRRRAEVFDKLEAELSRHGENH